MGWETVNLVAEETVDGKTHRKICKLRFNFAADGLSVIGLELKSPDGLKAKELSLSDTGVLLIDGAPILGPAIALTDAASIATDAVKGNLFSVTLEDNRTLADPTNLKEDVKYTWCIDQDATGTRTLDYGGKFKHPGGIAPTLTTTPNARDILSGICMGGNIHCDPLNADSK